MSLQQFEIVGNRGYFRPAGAMSLDEAVNLIDGALLVARQEGVKKFLVDTRALRGFDTPDLAERYWFSKKWAETIRGAVRVAVVARPELIDRDKFGVMVARNRGAVIDVFESETKAAAWLAIMP
jgi:hypothetical protein